MEDLQEAREIFSADKFATEAAGIQIDETGDNFARCSLVIEPRHLNAKGFVMGGAIFTLADFTFAVAANFHKPHVVSSSSQITYLGTAKGKKLLSEAKCIKDGKTTCFYEIDISDDLGTKVAFVTVYGIKMVSK